MQACVAHVRDHQYKMHQMGFLSFSMPQSCCTRYTSQSAYNQSNVNHYLCTKDKDESACAQDHTSTCLTFMAPCIPAKPWAVQDAPCWDKAGLDVRVKWTLSHEDFVERQGRDHFTKNQRVICSQASKWTGKCWRIRSGIIFKVQTQSDYFLFLEIKEIHMKVSYCLILPLLASNII